MNYKFLTEQPNADHLKFGHNELLDTVQSIVTHCDTPFTVGLFGKWGSGKSSIAEGLRSRLVKEGKGIPVILFDVWKHEGDALRRTFLKEIVRQLESAPYGDPIFKKGYHLKDTIDSSKQTATTENKGLDLRSLASVLKIIGTVALVLMVTYAILAKYHEHFSAKEHLLINKFFEYMFTGATLVTIAGWLFSNLKDFIKKSEITISEDRITDPHEFEAEFKRVLLNLANSRIVIIFDNLDRVSGESALEIISTIKTFLEPADRALEKKEVVFLLPCDVNAIKKHLSKVLRDQNLGTSGTDASADEFLRKFFNTILWIPDFYPIELERFATEKLAQTKIPEFNNQHLAWLIVQVFKDNPRQIIQFINTLISNFLLLYNKSKSNSFGDPNFYKENVSQLARYLLFTQRFPEVMDHYRATRTYDVDAEIIDKQVLGYAEFAAFRTHTSDIVIRSLEPFFTLKLSEQERAIPGVSKLLDLLHQNEGPNAAQYARELKINEKIEEFSQTVDNHLSSQANGVIICGFINGLFLLTKDLNMILRANSYREIQKKFESAQVLNLEMIKPSLLVSEFLAHSGNIFQLTINVKRKIVERWVGIVIDVKTNSEATKIRLERLYELDLHINILKHINELPSSALDNYTTTLAKYYGRDLELCQMILNHPRSSRIVRGELIQNIISNLVSYSREEIKYLKSVAELINGLSEQILTSVNADPILTKLTEFFNNQFLTKNNDEKQESLEAIWILIKSVRKTISNGADSRQLNDLAAALTLSYQQHHSMLHLYFLIFSELEKTGVERFVSLSRPVRMEFFQNLPTVGEENTEFTLQRLPNPSAIMDLPEHIPHLNNIVNQSESFLKVLYKFASNTIRYNWLIQLIRGHKFTWLNNALQTINSVEIPNNQLLFNFLSDNARKLQDPLEIEQSLQFLNDLNINAKEVNTNKLKEATTDLLKNTGVAKLIESYIKTSRFLAEG